MATERVQQSELGLKDLAGLAYDVLTDEKKREQVTEAAKTAKEFYDFFASDKKDRKQKEMDKAKQSIMSFLKESWERGNTRGGEFFSNKHLMYASTAMAGITLFSGGTVSSALMAGAAVYVAGKYVAPIVLDKVKNFLANSNADNVVKNFVQKNPSFKGMEGELKDLHKSLLRDSAELEGLKSLMDMNKDGKVNLEDLQNYTKAVREATPGNAKRLYNELTESSNVVARTAKESAEQIVTAKKEMPTQNRAMDSMVMDKKEPAKELSDVEKDEKTQREGLKYNREYDIAHGYPVGPEKPLQEILHPTVNKDMGAKKEEIAPKMEKFHMERPTGSLKAKVNEGNEKEMGSRGK